MAATAKSPKGPVAGLPRILLRLEGGALLLAAGLGYAVTDASWWTFLVLFLVPDVSAIGYAWGPRVGSAIYNLVHATALPLLSLGAALAYGAPGWAPYALIWLAHIGFDRALGFGLKLPSGFRDTHLGPIGGGGRARS